MRVLGDKDRFNFQVFQIFFIVLFVFVMHCAVIWSMNLPWLLFYSPLNISLYQEYSHMNYFTILFLDKSMTFGINKSRVIDSQAIVYESISSFKKVNLESSKQH